MTISFWDWSKPLSCNHRLPFIHGSFVVFPTICVFNRTGFLGPYKPALNIWRETGKQCILTPKCEKNEFLPFGRNDVFFCFACWGIPQTPQSCRRHGCAIFANRFNAGFRAARLFPFPPHAAKGLFRKERLRSPWPFAALSFFPALYGTPHTLLSSPQAGGRIPLEAP